jgi:hypothetical protein
VTVYYQIGGVAQNGVDYTNLSGVITVPANPGFAEIDVQAIEDSLLEFEESLKLTLIQTNTYLIDPAFASASITIDDNFGTNIFTVVTDINAPIGMDYHAPSNSLIVSFDFNAFGGPPTNFARIYLNGTNLEVGGWSGVSHVLDEVKLATVKKTANGFTNGEIYFGNDTVVGRVSADGTVANLTWCTLTNGIVINPLLLRGSLYVDQTGLFSNGVIVVTSDDSYQLDSKGVWRVDAQAHPTLLANISTLHLEGVVTLTNDVTRWGPWAGKIVTGDELDQSIFTIDTDGVVTKYFSTNIIFQGIQPEDFEIIPPNQDLYACDPNFGQIMKLSRAFLANYVGDLLITQAGEFAQGGKLFIVHWDGTGFVVRSIPYIRYGSPGHLEHVTFAPINLPSSPQ